MVMIKTLDDDRYLKHEYQRARRQLKDVDGNLMFDDDGKPIMERITLDWYLDYKPAYILTNETWMKNIVRKLAKTYPDSVEIEADNIPWFKASIDADFFVSAMEGIQ